MSQSNTPNRMTALGLLEQMRRANANREPEFNPISATMRERRAGPTASLFGGQRPQAPLPLPPTPPTVIPPPQAAQPQQAAARVAVAPQAAAPQGRQRASTLPVPPTPPQLDAEGNPIYIPPALLPQVAGAERLPMHERFNPENPYVATAIQMAERYNLPRNVFLSLIQQESGFRPDAVSPVGARGLGQLMPDTAADLRVNPYNPTENLEGSARYLREMLDRNEGNMPLALASYNAGLRRVRQAGNTIPNNPETQKYVPTVLRNAGVAGYAHGGLAHLEHKYAEGGPVASLPTYDINVRANRIRTPRRPAPREELTADQLNDMVLDRIAGRAAAASEAGAAAGARDRIRQTMGYAEGGLAELEHKYEGGGSVMSTVRDVGGQIVDAMIPRTPLDLALYAAMGPGSRLVKLLGTTGLAMLEPSEARGRQRAPEPEYLVRRPRHETHNLEELEHKYEGGGPVSLLTGLARRMTRRTPALRPDEVPMVAAHNAREIGLQKIAENDGVVVAPSIGISRADDPMTDFGEISLMASPQTIDPRRTPVYGRDAYTPRYPSVIPMTVRGREKDYVRLYNENTGQTRLLPHTPQNALRVMTNEPWRGGEDFITDNWLLGQMTPQFRNMSELRGARDRLVPNTDTQLIDWQTNQSRLRDEWRDALGPNYGVYSDSFERNLAEAAQRGPGGMEYINRTYYNNAIPPSLLERTTLHLNAGRDLPTTYFEAKPRRIVPLSEFEGAVVPQQASKDVTDLLRRYGVDDIQYYNRGDEADRAAQIRRFERLMFGAAPVAAGAAMSGEAAPEPEGYAEGGLADLHQKYESGGIVRRVARRAMRSAPEEIAENPRAVMGGNNPPRSVLKSTMTPDEAMAIATRPQPGAGVPRLEGDDLERANELSQRVLDFRAAQMRLPVDARVQPRPEDQLFPPARFDQPLEAGPSNVAQELESLRIQNISPTQSLPGSRAAAGLASDLAERYGTTMDRIVGDLDPIARIMRGEEVPGATPAQIASARAGEFYNMRPVYDVLRGQGVSHDEALRRIRQESQAIAGTSPRTDTEQNVLNSAFLQNRMARGLPVDANTVENVTGPGSGYGMIYDQHPALTQGLLEGTVSLAQNPKPTVFGRNISGDRSAVTADVHNVRAVNMIYNDVNPGGLPASSFDTAAKYREYVDAYTPNADGVVRGMSDDELREILVARPSGQKVRGQSISTEYPIYNDITTNIAERLGLTPADAQALMWFHYGPRTGLASEAHTVPELLNQRMSITSQALDIPPEEVLRLYTRNMIPLAGVAPAAILAREGEAAPSLEELDQRYADGGPVMSDEEYDRRLLSRMKAQTGRTTESTNAEQAQALRSAGYDAAQLASDIFLPQSPLDAALMVALGPGGRMARLAGSAALAAMEPSEAQAIISPRTARSIRMATRLPQDVRFREAVEATPGASITDDGLSLEVLRYQKPEQAGAQAIREGVFYLPATLPSRSVGTYRGTNRSNYGGPEMVRGETLLRAPLGVPGNTGGVVPERAFRELTSDANMRRLERDSRAAANSGLLGPEYRENIENFLNQWGGNPNVAHELVSNSRGGNRMRYALQENVIGNRARQEGYDSIVGTGARTPRITEVFDLREAAYPVPGSPEFEMLLPRFEDSRYAHGGLAQLEHKYAEGGAVSAQPAIYDPDAVNALANQIEAGYV
jgi:soluble lytic murein transglycosylase-like protein